MTLADSIAEVKIPIYGIVDHPFDLTLHNCFVHSGYRPSMTLMFTSPRYQPYSFGNCAHFQIETRSESLPEPARAFRFGTTDRDSTLDEMLQEQSKPVRNPFRWEGTLTIVGIPFYGTIQYYASPFRLSGFRLTSEETLLRGHAYGPSCDEVIELLEGLQVLNGRDEVLRQYDNP